MLSFYELINLASKIKLKESLDGRLIKRFFKLIDRCRKRKGLMPFTAIITLNDAEEPSPCSKGLLL